MSIAGLGQPFLQYPTMPMLPAHGESMGMTDLGCRSPTLCDVGEKEVKWGGGIRGKHWERNSGGGPSQLHFTFNDIDFRDGNAF